MKPLVKVKMGVLSELNSERILTPYSPVIYVNGCRITI